MAFEFLLCVEMNFQVYSNMLRVYQVLTSEESPMSLSRPPCKPTRAASNPLLPLLAAGCKLEGLEALVAANHERGRSSLGHLPVLGRKLLPDTG